MDPDHDRKISEHVLRMHRYRAATEQDGDGKSESIDYHISPVLKGFVTFL